MKYRGWITRQGSKWIEVFPQTASDVAKLGRVPSESKTFKPTDDPLVFPDGRQQMPILVKVSAWLEVTGLEKGGK